MVAADLGCQLDQQAYSRKSALFGAGTARAVEETMLETERQRNNPATHGSNGCLCSNEEL